MKAILEFNLPEDEGRYNIAHSAMDLYCTLLDIDRLCRDKLKHGELGTKEKEAYRAVREIVYSKVDPYEIAE